MNDLLKKDFYLLISEITKLEEEYEEALKTYNIYMTQMYNGYNGGRYIMENAKSKCNAKENEIKNVAKQISQLQLDSTMKNYYDLYKEKSELLKESYMYQTQIDSHGSAFLLGFPLDCEEAFRLKYEIKEFETKKRDVDNKISSINAEMNIIYLGVVYSNSELKL